MLEFIERDKRYAILFTFVFTNNIKLDYIICDCEEQICYSYRIYSIKRCSVYSRGAFILFFCILFIYFLFTGIVQTTYRSKHTNITKFTTTTLITKKKKENRINK